MVSTNVKFIAQSHLDEWVNGSAVLEAIAKLNIETLSTDLMNEIVKPKYPIKSEMGWQCRGVNWRTGEPMGTRYGQVKPDSPHVIDPEKNPEKTAKYLTPSGMEPDAIFLAMPDKDYWQKVYDDISIDRHWTEGGKKAGSGLSIDLAVIALTGVWNWGKDGKLAPEVDKWVQPGTQHFINFDSDYAKNPSCRKAILQFAYLIEAKGAKVKIPVWDSQFKGMDDYIKANGSDAFKQKIATALTIQQWEKQFDNPEDTSSGKRKKPPLTDIVAAEIAEEYKDILAFNNETKQWMRYSADTPGMWSVESNEYIEAIIKSIITGKGIRGYGSFSYITNIIRELRTLLIERKWVERPANELLPFKNGVLEIATGKLLEHSPGFRFTWQLPRVHNPLAEDWSGIDAFFDHISDGKQSIKNLLLCFCNAVLKGRSDLQKFMHLIGLAGTGKGSFGRLLVDLIGQMNVCSTTMDDWCNNRFEAVKAYRKRLVIFWDEDKQSGKIGKFLSLTGGDWIRSEQKGEKGFDYVYDGMTLVLSNLPIFTGDAVSRVARRAITVPCNKAVSLGQKRDINKEFQAELDAFTNYLLTIPDEKVTQTLSGLADIPECTLEFWESRIRTDSIAAWVNDWVIYDVLAQTPIGADKSEADKGDPITLYGSYALHCKQSGTQPKANKNFSPDLLELCRSVLKWEVDRKVTKTGKFIKGLRLRDPSDTDIPSHDYTLMQNVTSGDGSGDGLSDGSGDGSQPLQDNASSSGDGLTSTLNEIEKNNLELEAVINTVEECLPSPVATSLASANIVVECDQSPVTRTEPLPVKEFDPSPAPVNRPVTAPVTSLKGSPYPGRVALNQTKEPKAIAEKLRNVKTLDDCQQILNEYKHQRDCVRWVWVNLLTDAERQQLLPIIKGEIVQLDLSANADETSTPSIKVGDRVIVVKTGQVGVVTKHQEIDKSFKIKISEVEEWFYSEDLEGLIE